MEDDLSSVSAAPIPNVHQPQVTYNLTFVCSQIPAFTGYESSISVNEFSEELLAACDTWSVPPGPQRLGIARVKCEGLAKRLLDVDSELRKAPDLETFLRLLRVRFEARQVSQTAMLNKLSAVVMRPGDSVIDFLLRLKPLVPKLQQAFRDNTPVDQLEALTPRAREKVEADNRTRMSTVNQMVKNHFINALTGPLRQKLLEMDRVPSTLEAAVEAAQRFERISRSTTARERLEEPSFFMVGEGSPAAPQPSSSSESTDAIVATLNAITARLNQCPLCAQDHVLAQCPKMRQLQAPQPAPAFSQRQPIYPPHRGQPFASRPTAPSPPDGARIPPRCWYCPQPYRPHFHAVCPTLARNPQAIPRFRPVRPRFQKN